MAIKTEHTAAKNGGGYWGRRAEAKHVTARLRRRDSQRMIREAQKH